MADCFQFVSLLFFFSSSVFIVLLKVVCKKIISSSYCHFILDFHFTCRARLVELFVSYMFESRFFFHFEMFNVILTRLVCVCVCVCVCMCVCNFTTILFVRLYFLHLCVHIGLHSLMYMCISS